MRHQQHWHDVCTPPAVALTIFSWRDRFIVGRMRINYWYQLRIHLYWWALSDLGDLNCIKFMIINAPSTATFIRNFISWSCERLINQACFIHCSFLWPIHRIKAICKLKRSFQHPRWAVSKRVAWTTQYQSTRCENKTRVGLNPCLGWENCAAAWLSDDEYAQDDPKLKQIRFDRESYASSVKFCWRFAARMKN